MTLEELLAWVDEEGQNDRRNASYGLVLIAAAILELSDAVREARHDLP